MAQYKAGDHEASDLESSLHQQGHEHLRVRRHGALLVVESGPEDDPVAHARMRRVAVSLWTLEMATHLGRWEATGLRGQYEEIKEKLIHDYGWTLTPID